MAISESENASFVDDVFGGDAMSDDHSQDTGIDVDAEVENDDAESEEEDKD